jgi:hypothetical protein
MQRSHQGEGELVRARFPTCESPEWDGGEQGKRKIPKGVMAHQCTIVAQVANLWRKRKGDAFHAWNASDGAKHLGYY